MTRADMNNTDGTGLRWVLGTDTHSNRTNRETPDERIIIGEPMVGKKLFSCDVYVYECPYRVYRQRLSKWHQHVILPNDIQIDIGDMAVGESRYFCNAPGSKTGICDGTIGYAIEKVRY